ncbi:hypothetical protein S83_003259, partial [Arachis hypogaea]
LLAGFVAKSPSIVVAGGRTVTFTAHHKTRGAGRPWFVILHRRSSVPPSSLALILDAAFLLLSGHPQRRLHLPRRRLSTSALPFVSAENIPK